MTTKMPKFEFGELKATPTNVALTVAAAVGGVVVYRLAKFWSWRRKVMKEFDGPEPSLLLGNLPDFEFNADFYSKLHSEYGDVARYFLLPGMLNVSISNPKYFSEVYKQTSSRPKETQNFLFYLGNENLLFQHGPIVKQIRLHYNKMITAASQLSKLNEIAYRNFAVLTKPWGDAKEVDLHKVLGPAIYDIMGQVMFGNSWIEHNGDIYAHHVHLIEHVQDFMLYPFHPYYKASYREYQRRVKALRGRCADLIDERARLIAANPKEWENDESALTLLNTAVDNKGKPFFNRELQISTMIGFLNGAYDTTHATLYWLFWNLAKNPDKQAILRDEIRKVMGTSKTATLDQARDIKYLDCFLRESTRRFATVPVNQRINYDRDIKVGPYTIPKGTCINLPNFIMFDDKKAFGDNTSEFWPERFLAEENPNSDAARSAWMPFGAASRMCVGFTFAMVELKACLITVLQQYHVALVNPNDEGKSMFEAGVLQPAVKNSFVFTRL